MSVRFVAMLTKRSHPARCMVVNTASRRRSRVAESGQSVVLITRCSSGIGGLSALVFGRLGRRYFLGWLLCLLSPALVEAEVAVPSIVGPITGPGAPALASTSFSLAPFGYREEEFFIAGMATGYVTEGTLSSDGKWSVSPGQTVAYETRMLVRRPTTRERFNGTVVVEWLNVSGGFDAGPDWTSTHTMLMREGFAWVGVSTQSVGINGGPPLNRNLHLKAVN